jgi:hypothetical protein
VKSGKDIPPHQFSHSAQTTLQNGHSQKLKEALLQGRSGRMTGHFGSWGAVGGLGIKKEEHLRTPLANAKIIIKRTKNKWQTKTLDRAHASGSQCPEPTERGKRG